jgi:hypothetical protein
MYLCVNENNDMIKLSSLVSFTDMWGPGMVFEFCMHFYQRKVKVKFTLEQAMKARKGS